MPAARATRSHRSGAQPPVDDACVKTTNPKAAAAARIGAALARRKRVELLELLRPCFARTEPWLQAGKYAAVVMSQIPERNAWTIAAHAGDRAPDKTQRLLSRAVWDTFAAMGVVRRFAVAGLVEAAARTGRRRGLAVGAIDETGQVKAGTQTAGVKRQYLGCVGKVANGINTVHLAYVREGTGHALIAERLRSVPALTPWLTRPVSYRGAISFAGPDAERAVYRRYPDLPVTDGLGPGMLGDDLDYCLGVVIQYDEVQSDLRQQHGHTPAAWTGDPRRRADEVAVLSPETSDIGHGQAANALVGQGRDQFVEFFRPDDGGDQFHGRSAFHWSC